MKLQVEIRNTCLKGYLPSKKPGYLEISSTWIENTFIQKAFDKALVEDSLKWLYGLIGLHMPTIYYAESPMGCQTATHELKSERLKKGLEWKNINCQARYEIEHQVNRPVSAKVSGEVRKHIWEQTKQLGITKLQFEFHLKTFWAVGLRISVATDEGNSVVQLL